MADKDPVQNKFRSMILDLSGRLNQCDCEGILYLYNLPKSDCDKSNFPLHVLSSLEANGHISPWDVECLEEILTAISRHDLLTIVNKYRESKEYKAAKKEQKRKGRKRATGSCNAAATDAPATDTLSKTASNKKRLRSLYTLLITHITGLTQVMEFLRDELDRMGEEEEGVEEAMQQFLRVARSGEDFTESLHKVFRDMGVKRNSTSSNEDSSEAAATPTDAEGKCLDTNLALETPSKENYQKTAAMRKKPVPLPRTKVSRIPRNLGDLDFEIYENLKSMKQEEGANVSLAQYRSSLVSTSTPKLSHGGEPGFEAGDEEEEDATENTGDSGIAEWTGHRIHSEGDLLGVIDHEESKVKTDPIYTALLLHRSEAIYTTVGYGKQQQQNRVGKQEEQQEEKSVATGE